MRRGQPGKSRFAGRSLAGAVGAVLVGATASGNPATPVPDTLRVETEYVEYARWVKERRRDDPTDKVAQQPPQPLEVSTTPPAAARTLPPGAAAFATFAAGGRTVALAFAPTTGASATVAVDRNADGDLTGAGETFPIEAKDGGNGGAFWWLPSCALSEEGASKDGAPSACIGVTFWRIPQALWFAQATANGEDGKASDLQLVAAPPQGAKGPGLPGTTLYATAHPKDRDVLVAFVVRDGAVGVVVDRNGNRDLSDDGAPSPATGAATAEGTRAWEASGVAIDDVPTRLALQEKTRARYTCQVAPSGARRGTVTCAGAPYALHLLDSDHDGACTSKADRWWFGPAADCGKMRELNPATMVEGDEPVFTAGPDGLVAWRLASAGADGAVTLARDPKADRSAYFERRSERVRKEWFARFDAEAAEFRKANGIDPARPRAAEPARWLHDVDLAAGLARGAAEKKPVLVDFEADWCQWCYRFEYYLYPDAEVADLLKRFVLVKVNYEFHTTGEFERLKAPRSLPVLFVLDGQGEPVSFPLTTPDGKTEETFRIARFLPPASFAAALRSALGAWDAREKR